MNSRRRIRPRADASLYHFLAHHNSRILAEKVPLPLEPGRGVAGVPARDIDTPVLERVVRIETLEREWRSVYARCSEGEAGSREVKQEHELVIYDRKLRHVEPRGLRLDRQLVALGRNVYPVLVDGVNRHGERDEERAVRQQRGVVSPPLAVALGVRECRDGAS